MHTPFAFLVFPLNLFLDKLHVDSDDGNGGISPDNLLLSNRSRVSWAIPCNCGMSPFILLELISSDLSDVSWESSEGIDENLLEAGNSEGVLETKAKVVVYEENFSPFTNLHRFRFWRTDSRPISVGMFPDSWFAAEANRESKGQYSERAVQQNPVQNQTKTYTKTVPKVFSFVQFVS